MNQKDSLHGMPDKSGYKNQIGTPVVTVSWGNPNCCKPPMEAIGQQLGFTNDCHTWLTCWKWPLMFGKQHLVDSCWPCGSVTSFFPKAGLVMLRIYFPAFASRGFIASFRFYFFRRCIYPPTCARMWLLGSDDFTAHCCSDLLTRAILPSRSFIIAR